MGFYPGNTNRTPASKALSWTEGEQQQHCAEVRIPKIPQRMQARTEKAA